MAVGLRASGGATNVGNNSAMAWTVPAACQVGDVIVLTTAQNNTDLLISRPPSVVVRDRQVQSQWYTELCTVVVDGVRVSASTVLSFPLTGTRAWQVAGQAFTGVDPGTPLAGLIGSSAISGATIVTPSGSLGGYLVEAGSAKGNGTTITSWSAPAGWTIAAQGAGVSTFGPSGFLATYDSNPAVFGTFGGDTYTPDVAGQAQSRWTLALNELGYVPPAVSALITRRRP